MSRSTSIISKARITDRIHRGLRSSLRCECRSSRVLSFAIVKRAQKSDGHLQVGLFSSPASVIADVQEVFHAFKFDSRHEPAPGVERGFGEAFGWGAGRLAWRPVPRIEIYLLALSNYSEMGRFPAAAVTGSETGSGSGQDVTQRARRPRSRRRSKSAAERLRRPRVLGTDPRSTRRTPRSRCRSRSCR